VSPSAVQSVVFGCRSDEGLKNDIKLLLQKRKDAENIAQLIAEVCNKEYSLKYIPLSA
jgi:hypothetical protein